MSDAHDRDAGEILSAYLCLVSGTIELLPALLRLSGHSSERPVQIESRLEQLLIYNSRLRRLGDAQKNLAAELDEIADSCGAIGDAIAELYQFRDDVAHWRRLTDRIDYEYANTLRKLQSLSKRGITIAYLPRAQKKRLLLRPISDGESEVCP